MQGVLQGVAVAEVRILMVPVAQVLLAKDLQVVPDDRHFLQEEHRVAAAVQEKQDKTDHSR